VARNGFSWPDLTRPPTHPVADNPAYQRIIADMEARAKLARAITELEGQVGHGEPVENERRRARIETMRRQLAAQMTMPAPMKPKGSRVKNR